MTPPPPSRTANGWKRCFPTPAWSSCLAAITPLPKASASAPADDREVSGLVISDDLRLVERRAVVHSHGDTAVGLAAVLVDDTVPVGDDIPVGRHDDTRRFARLLLPDAITALVHVHR